VNVPISNWKEYTGVASAITPYPIHKPTAMIPVNLSKTASLLPTAFPQEQIPAHHTSAARYAQLFPNFPGLRLNITGLSGLATRKLRTSCGIVSVHGRQPSGPQQKGGASIENGVGAHPKVRHHLLEFGSTLAINP
jgi:hypothetical protein